MLPLVFSLLLPAVLAASPCEGIADDIHASMVRITTEHCDAGKSKGAAFWAIDTMLREEDPPIVLTGDQSRCWRRALRKPWNDCQAKIERQDRKRREELVQEHLDSLKAKFDLDGEWRLNVDMNGYLVESLISARDTRLTIRDHGALRSRTVLGTIRSESDELTGVPGTRIELQITRRSMKVKITRKSGRNDELTGVCKWHPAEDGKPDRLIGQLTGYKFHNQKPPVVGRSGFRGGRMHVVYGKIEPHPVEIGFTAIRNPATTSDDPS